MLPLWFELLCYKCFLSHRSVVFVYPPTTPVHLPCLWTHSVRSSFLSLLSLDHSGAASGIILLKVWQFAAFVDVVLVSSNWIYLELKNSHSASSCSPGFRGQRLSLNCFPRTVGSAPHQGACADLNRVCTWACRRLRRACSCSVRVSSASCGVHCASTSKVSRRASTGTNVLGASACNLCRTYCYRDRWLRFSPCRAHRLHLHLW